MRIVKLLLLIFLSFTVSACATHSPYPEGKSPADVPSRVDVIRLNDIKMIDAFAFSLKDANGNFNTTTNLSDSDREVVALAKRTILNQLANYGYKVAEPDAEKFDIQMQFFINYVPEWGFLVHRLAQAGVHVMNCQGELLFEEFEGKYNANGVLDAMMASRDDMVAGITQQAVIKTVTELQKGTKEMPVEPTPSPAKAGKK